ncbi:Benzoylformate decarboxylase [Neofusicoccum parvum]|nr:Benzoylformate decarboxylase [Neofusicoccum parvum]
MPFETLTTAPAVGDFTPLQEHQEQTPGTFFDAKPVLHLHAADVQLLVSHADLADQSVFPDLRAAAPTNGAAINGSASDDTPLAIPNLSVWVTSKNLLIHSPSAGKGVSIPYPTITLHAIQRLTPPAAPATETSGLYMQLLLNATDHTADDDLQTLEITLVPSAATTPIAALFAAVSACADLNPDPQDTDSEAGEDEDGGLQVLGGGAGLPGAGGWITSENVGEHVDAEGNFVGFGGGGASLGAGAGTVHGRDDEEEDEAGEEAGGEASGEAGAGAGGEDAKWRRTE